MLYVSSLGLGRGCKYHTCHVCRLRSRCVEHRTGEEKCSLATSPNRAIDKKALPNPHVPCKCLEVSGSVTYSSSCRSWVPGVNSWWICAVQTRVVRKMVWIVTEDAGRGWQQDSKTAGNGAGGHQRSFAPSIQALRGVIMARKYSGGSPGVPKPSR